MLQLKTDSGLQTLQKQASFEAVSALVSWMLFFRTNEHLNFFFFFLNQTFQNKEWMSRYV